MADGSAAPRKVAVTGSSGLLGSAVRAALAERGDTVTRVVRSREAARPADAVYWDPARRVIDRDGLAGHDAVINLAGETIYQPWTSARKDRIYHSRVGGTRLLAEALGALPTDRRPPVLVCASAIGYFGSRPYDEPLPEDAPPGDTFMARLVRDWEAAAGPAARAGVRVVHLRFAPVVHPDAFLLQATTLPTRLGLGATLGDGRQPLPWITRDDVVGIVEFALATPALRGPVNAVAPERITNREFADTLARVLGRPRVLRIPRLALKLLGDLGNEVGGGAWVVPEKLKEAGYTWRDPALEPALRRLLERP